MFFSSCCCSEVVEAAPRPVPFCSATLQSPVRKGRCDTDYKLTQETGASTACSGPHPKPCSTRGAGHEHAQAPRPSTCSCGQSWWESRAPAAWPALCCCCAGGGEQLRFAERSSWQPGALGLGAGSVFHSTWQGFNRAWWCEILCETRARSL